MYLNWKHIPPSDREEAEKLIASLRSYVKENGTGEEQVDHVNNEGQRRPPIMTPAPALALESAPSNGQLTDAQRWREERTKARQEQKSNLWPGGSGKENGTPTGAGTSEVRQEYNRNSLNCNLLCIIFLIPFSENSPRVF